MTSYLLLELLSWGGFRGAAVGLRTRVGPGGMDCSVRCGGVLDDGKNGAEAEVDDCVGVRKEER